MRIGYARVSTQEQDTQAQIAALKESGCERIFQEKASGGRWNRPELHRLLEHLRIPRTAAGCFAPLFRREIGPAQHGLALVETIAHLNCLLRRGEVLRSLNPAGAWEWERR